MNSTLTFCVIVGGDRQRGMYSIRKHGEPAALRNLYTLGIVALAPEFGSCNLEFYAELVRPRRIRIPAPHHAGTDL